MRLRGKSTLSAWAILLLFSLSFPLHGEEPRFILNSGPGGPATFMLTDSRSQLVFTGGEAGNLEVWDRNSGEKLYNQRLSRFPLRMAALHPAKTEIAVVTSDSLNSFILTVWDWKEGIQKDSYKLSELPLFMKYSPTGSFLVYGVTRYQSLTFLDTSNGAVLPYLTEGFGIVSEAFISGSERTILTYSPSGSIQYWDIQEGTMRQRISTLANLTRIQFTPNGRYMAATNNQGLLLVDLVSGTPRQQIPLPAINQMNLSSSGELLSVYHEHNSGYRLSLYRIDGASLIPSANYTNLGLRRINSLLTLSDALFFALPTGDLHTFSITREKLSLYASSSIRRVTDLGANSRHMLISTSRELFTLENRFLQADSRLDAQNFNLTDRKISFGGRPGIVDYDGESFLIFNRDGSEGVLALVSPEGDFLLEYTGYPYAFNTLTVRGDQVAALDRKGDIHLIDLTTGEIRFSFSSFGIQSLAFTGDNTLVAGRGQSSTIPTPLLQLNTLTGETVDLADSNLLTFQLIYDPLTRILYSLGIEERRRQLRTVLKEHDGVRWEKIETLSTVIGENLDAHMLVEKEGSRIFTSLGSRGINMLYWGGFTPFEEGPGLPGKIITLDDFLVALNKDGSLGFWNVRTGTLAYTLYLFSDDHWVALLPEGRFQSSPGGEKYLSVFEGSSTKKLNTENYRL